MNYNGFEIFVLALGNADSIFIRHYSENIKTTILIDGGNRSDGVVVLRFLGSLGESHIDHLVCSHHHADHAGGLIDVVKERRLSVGTAWVHIEELVSDLDITLSLHFQNQQEFAKKASLSKSIQQELLTALAARGITPAQPFAGEGLQIGPLYILSPTRDFYRRQIQRMQSEDLQNLLNARYVTRQQRTSMLQLIKESLDTMEEDAAGLGGEPTSPENEVSTVLALCSTDNKIYLFTADAGVEALSEVVSVYNDAVKDVQWMQIPHHGSRRNLNEALLDHYCPKVGVVSAKGTVKHPSRKLVNAVKSRGGRVYGSYYPHKEISSGRWTRWYSGNVPQMDNLVNVPPLWEDV